MLCVRVWVSARFGCVCRYMCMCVCVCVCAWVRHAHPPPVCSPWVALTLSRVSFCAVRVFKRTHNSHTHTHARTHTHTHTHKHTRDTHTDCKEYLVDVKARLGRRLHEEQPVLFRVRLWCESVCACVCVCMCVCVCVCAWVCNLNRIQEGKVQCGPYVS